MIQSRGLEGDEEDDVHDKIVSWTIGRRQEAVQRLVVGGIWFNEGLLKLGRVQVVAVHRARLTTVLNATEHLRAIHNAVLLTVGGRGTRPGVHVEVAAYRDKPERCVL